MPRDANGGPTKVVHEAKLQSTAFFIVQECNERLHKLNGIFVGSQTSKLNARRIGHTNVFMID